MNSLYTVYAVGITRALATHASLRAEAYDKACNNASRESS